LPVLRYPDDRARLLQLLQDPEVRGGMTMVRLLTSTSGAALRNAVLREIDHEPLPRGSDVAVAAEDGLVTLIGCVGNRGVKVAAERVAKGVPGVRIVANDILVKGGRERTDTDIARDALHCLRNNRAVPDSVQAVVGDGFITLDGTVSSLHQRRLAESAVKYIQGVKGIHNDITLQAPPGLVEEFDGRG
jgi:osmotically-inducible protein OsmY